MASAIALFICAGYAAASAECHLPRWSPRPPCARPHCARPHCARPCSGLAAASACGVCPRRPRRPVSYTHLRAHETLMNL
eukprot:1010370-Prymnesium_polylepis.1